MGLDVCIGGVFYCVLKNLCCWFLCFFVPCRPRAYADCGTDFFRPKSVRSRRELLYLSSDVLGSCARALEVLDYLKLPFFVAWSRDPVSVVDNSKALRFKDSEDESGTGKPRVEMFSEELPGMQD